jgi:hypothetical protein
MNSILALPRLNHGTRAPGDDLVGGAETEENIPCRSDKNTLIKHVEPDCSRSGPSA